MDPMPALDRLDVVVVELPLIEPWRTAHGTLEMRRTVLVRVESEGAEGWGECPAMPTPGYSSEWADEAAAALRGELGPALLRGQRPDPSQVAGRPMAACSIEAALGDLELRRRGHSLASHLGATRSQVPAGIVVGLQPDETALRSAVDAAVAERYRRVKVKVTPGREAAWLAGVRRDHPTLDLWVDANGAFDPADAGQWAELRGLDELGLGLIEQPFGATDLASHAALAAAIGTPVCLDEPLDSLGSVRHAVESGACAVVNLKPARVGGWRRAIEILDWCGAHHVGVWIGGLVESGVGRAANVAFAAHPAVTLVSDLSPSSRFFRRDVVAEPITMADGWIAVPTGPGIGVEVSLDRLGDVSDGGVHRVETVRARRSGA